MTIYSSAYATTAMNGSLTSKIEESVRRLRAMLFLHELQHGVYAVTGVDGTTTTPIFNYPLPIKDSEGDYVVMDARTLVVLDDVSAGGFRPRNGAEWTGKVLQAVLTRQWMEGRVTQMRDVSLLPLAVYASWIGETLAQRFHLDARTQLQLSTLAAIQYLNNFWEKSNADREDVGYLLSAISRATGFRSGDLVEVIEAHPIINGVEHLVQVMKDYTKNVRLSDLNAVTFIDSVSGGWYGNAGREMAAVGLEYPPTWIALVFQAVTDQGYKKSRIADIANRSSLRKYTADYVRHFAELTYA